MPSVVFVAPYFLDTTMRFVSAAARLPGVRFGLISTDPEEKLPSEVRTHLAAHYRVPNCLDPDQMALALEGIAAQIGPVDRLLGTLEELQVPLAQVRERFGITGMGVEAALNFRDKSRMKSALRAAGVPCARHKLAENEGEARDFARAVGYPLVLKPPAGAGARSTYRVESDDQMRQALASERPSPAAPVLIEEFVTGDEHSFDSVMIGGKLVWYSICRYFPPPLHVLENPWIQWAVLIPREAEHPGYDPIRRAGTRALEVLGMQTGLSHMEWFQRKDDGVAISEVAARPPGAQFTSLISYANDFDLYAAWARLLVYDLFTPPERSYAAGIAFLRGQGQGRVRAVRGVEQIQREIGAFVVEAKLPRPGQPPTGTYEGEGYVIVRHPDTEKVEQMLALLVRVLRVELA
jgi:biotin carboxylase